MKLRTTVMQLGCEQIELDEFRPRGAAYPRDSHSPDLWFQHFAIVVSDMRAAYARLLHAGIVPITTGGPQTLPEQDGHVQAYKFRDPDGHPLELLHFPAGRGRSVWQRRAHRVFLGIDHTAIAVASTAASEVFYRDLLAMNVAYEAINSGPTQERLDGTFGARVRITGLRPRSAQGPGIELLDYRAPPTGRRLPTLPRGTDIAHVRVVLRVDNIDTLLAALDEQGVRFVSPGVITLPGGRRAVQVLDPDGHALIIEQSRGASMIGTSQNVSLATCAVTKRAP